MDSVLFHLKELCSVHNSLRKSKNHFQSRWNSWKTNSVNVNKSDQNSIHHYRCIIFPSPPILPSFQTELSISCCWSACKFLNFLSAQWDQNYFEVAFKFSNNYDFQKYFLSCYSCYIFQKLSWEIFYNCEWKLFSSFQHIDLYGKKISGHTTYSWNNKWDKRGHGTQWFHI